MNTYWVPGGGLATGHTAGRLDPTQDVHPENE